MRKASATIGAHRFLVGGRNGRRPYLHPMTVAAAALAARLHAGKVDKPHLDHLTVVVTILRERWPRAPAFALMAAWPHDAIEDAGDTDAGDTDAELRSEGVSEEAVRPVEMLTRPASGAGSSA